MTGPGARAWLPRPALHWLLLAQGALILQHIGHLPFWLAPLLIVALGYRIQVQRGRWSLPPQWLKLVGVAAGFIGTWLSFGTLAGLEATASLLLIAAALKLLEAHSRRDAYLLLFLGYFCVLAGFLFAQTPGAALYALLPVVLLTSALLALHDGADSALSTLKGTALLLVQSLPIMLILFLVVPRLAPFWAVPQPNSAARTGMGGEVGPGDVAALSRSDRLAMRVRFEGVAPDHAELYWRGVVLSHFDGRRWLPWPDHNRSEALAAAEYADGVAAEEPRRTLQYQVLQEPSHQPWRFALAYPVAVQGEARLTADHRVIGRPVHERVVYTVRSDPDWRPDRQLSAHDRKLALALPAGFNPRTVAWGEELRRLEEPRQRIRQVLAQFRERDFVYTLQPPLLGRDSVDEFLFDSRRGFCEHYASSFAYLMRAAGIPARLVAGYQGGEINPITGSVLVHDYDAHAWTEVWLEDEGWVRVDPTAAVAPERIEQGLESALAGEFMADSPLAAVRYRDISWVNRLWLQVDAFNDQWALWVLGYRGERQWQALGALLGEVSPWRLSLLLLAGAGLPLLLVALWLWQGQRRPADLQAQRYRRLCRRLSAAGHPPLPGEAPGTYLHRVAAAEPRWGAALRRIAALFNDLRYRRLDDSQRASLQRALRTELIRFQSLR